MKFLPFLISSAVTLLLVILLNSPWGKIPPIGKFLSPQHGFWQNAEPVDKDFGQDLQLPGLKDPAEVYLDDRLVPHIFASNDADAFYLQGYLHAKFRLWQMEFQTYAAAGRISELIGPKALNYDREKRRLGMGYAAEKAVVEMEKDSVSKSEADAYTAGVNAYITGLKESELPVEYKLLNYKPELWSNLKTALFLKFMSLDLAGAEDDFEYTNLRSLLGYTVFNKMFPVQQDSLDPIVSHDTLPPKPGILVKAPVGSDSAYLYNRDAVHVKSSKPDPDNGSNNWAVSGKKTKSGAPILCNDPHLGLHLPSLWYEMQLSCPSFNAYGASFPGAPGIIIGFNDSCAFGFTNAMRDVRDYYEIKFKDDSRKEYWYNGEWRTTDFRYEHILMKDTLEYTDTVAYTIFGPVMYDKSFSGGRQTNNNYYAVRWKAHDAGNELMIFNALDHAKNYADYLSAIKWLHTPGQNAIFACKNGDIAICDQGEFPAKWKRQGDFVMPGTDSTYAWQGMIPQEENPKMVNPQRGFVSSANQYPVYPSEYPYYLGGNYPNYRGMMINRYLNQMNDIGIPDMMRLQTDNYNLFAEMARPVLLKNIDPSVLDETEKRYYDLLQEWDLRYEADSKAPSVFKIVWDSLTAVVWNDDLEKDNLPGFYPNESTLLEGILRDSSYEFLDDIRTPEKETLKEDVLLAFKRGAAKCRQLDSEGILLWGKMKGTVVEHLANLDPFSRLNIMNSGGKYAINAVKKDHGPSWRMIVQLSANTEAYGIYPGGQSGNPGSAYYDNFIDNWATGKYYPLWLMSKEEETDKRVKAIIRVTSL
ncbi:MAG: penicillin acylase family protein [Bacteroidota bacterium]|nr:penicillin acylase family protein [Bacteroidota bacterium]